MTRDPLAALALLLLFALVVAFWAGVGYFLWPAFGLSGRL